MLNLKEKRPQIAQILLMVLLMCMPMLYFVQKYDYIHGELYTAQMSKVSNQMGEKLERQLLWNNSKDENNGSMIYTAYYYPQALSLVCHTTPIQNQSTPPTVAYLVSDQGTLYPAEIAWDGEYNTTLLVFEDIPKEAIDNLAYLDVIPEEEGTAVRAEYDPNIQTPKRVRYRLHTI